MMLPRILNWKQAQEKVNHRSKKKEKEEKECKKCLKNRKAERSRSSGHDVLGKDWITRDIRSPVQANGTVRTHTGSQNVYSRN